MRFMRVEIPFLWQRLCCVFLAGGEGLTRTRLGGWQDETLGAPSVVAVCI